MKIEFAMVLAAGLGKRMRPLTESRPKPLVELCGRTLLDRALDRLHAAAVRHIVVNSHYMGDQIARHLRDRAGITLSPESELLETGGGVHAALPQLGSGPFFVVNSDAVWSDGSSPALDRLAQSWKDDSMDALLMLVRMEAVASTLPGHPGDYHLEVDGRLRRRSGNEKADYLFGGVQILHPRLFDGAPTGRFSLNLLFDRAQSAGRLYGLCHDGAWYHVGTPQELAAAESALSAAGAGAGQSS